MDENKNNDDLNDLDDLISDLECGNYEVKSNIEEEETEEDNSEDENINIDDEEDEDEEETEEIDITPEKTKAILSLIVYFHPLMV